MSTAAWIGASSPPSPAPTLRDRWHRVCEPAASGLPRWWILLWFPALLLLLLLGFTALGISGSSTGAYWQLFGTGPDPALLAGTPRAVRSDEWLTQGSWIVSQAQQGFPALNQSLPGGMDGTVLLGLPAWDWSTLFRPDAFGFMLVGLNHGMAVRWWLPAFAMTAACYAMLVGFLPRRPVTSAVVAVAFFFSPLLQWWFLPSLLWPAALGFLAIAATVFSLRDPRWWVRIAWSALTCYVAVCATLMLYPPVLIAAVLVAAAICLGAVLAEAGRGRLGPRVAVRRMLPLLVGGLAAALLVGTFFVTKSQVVGVINDTVYPGHRLASTGAAGANGVVQLFGGPFAGGIDGDGGYAGLLGVNSSEASSPVLIGLFLVIPLCWFLIRDWRVDRHLHWEMLACAAATALFTAYLLIPGWDPLAHLLLLDRTTANRSRMAFALLSVVAIALLARRLDEGSTAPTFTLGQNRTALPIWVSAVTTAAAGVSIAVVWVVLAQRDDQALTGVTLGWIVAALFVLSVLLYTRGRPAPASAAFLLVSVLLTVGVNPLYRGIFDLTRTAMGQEIERIDDAKPGAWLGIGSYQLGAVLFETAVRSFNGVQLYPSEQMWQQIDPDHRYQSVSNRYASLAWVPGVGEPVAQNPQDDVISLTFDSCSSFGQQQVSYVLADHAVQQSCLRQIDQVTQGPSTYWFYEVVR